MYILHKNKHKLVKKRSKWTKKATSEYYFFSPAVAYLIGALEMQKFGFLFWLLFIWNSKYKKSKGLIIKQIIVAKTHPSILYLLVYK